MEIQREKQKVINRNGWQVKLFRYVTGSEPKFVGWCPFFWATTVNLGLLPFAFAGHAFDGAVDTLKKCWPESKPKFLKPRKEKPYWPNDSELNSRYFGNAGDIEELCWSSERIIYPYARFLQWETQNPTWREQYKVKLEKEKEIEERAKLRREAIQEKKDKIAKWGQYAVKPLLVASAGAVCLVVYKIAFFLFSLITLENVISAGLILGGIAAVGGLIWGVCRGLKWIFNRVDTDLDIQAPRVIVEPVTKIGSFFSELFDFVIDAIRITYLKRCPLIVWSETETRPIEKIKSE